MDRKRFERRSSQAARAVVIAAAKAQAAQEARQLWHLDEGEPLPFDSRFEHVAQVTALALRLATCAQG